MLSTRYDAKLQDIVQDYAEAQARLQGVSNPSGSLWNGTGLAEPKFNADFTEYTGNWGTFSFKIFVGFANRQEGRPQRDGPPLRAIALISYAHWLVAQGYSAAASELLWPIIRNDLAYVGQYWYDMQPQPSSSQLNL